MPENKIIDFWTHYSYLCLKSKVCPLKSVIKNLKGTELCLTIENIRCEHWPFLLSALSVDHGLTKVQFWSNYFLDEERETFDIKKKRSNTCFPIPYGCSAKNITDIFKCLSDLLHVSKTLKVLLIENLCLRYEDIQNIAVGLKNSNIEKLSLCGCRLQEEYVEILCKSLQTSNIVWLDFSSCGLNITDLIFVCDLIKAHHLKRSNDMFPDTLRYRLPVLDIMKGLRRISMNNNDIGDKGIEILMESLQEDIWMKALDLQKCSIENGGARSILKILKSNVGLQVIDIRQNNIEQTLIDRISLQLSLNNVQKKNKYELGTLWKPPKVRKFIRCKAVRTKSMRHISPPKSRTKLSIEEQLKKTLQLYNETEKELNHIKNFISEKENIQVKETYSQTDLEVNYELLEAKNALSRELKIKDSLKQLVKKYKMENNLLRKELEKMDVLKDYIFLDHETFNEVKNTFEKFKTFLDLMKKYGLWECIERLGLNEKTDIAMKPIIIDAMKNCVKVVESHLSIPKNEAQSSTGRSIRTDEQSFTKIHHETISNAKNNYQGVIPKVSKTLKGDEHIPIEQSYQYRYDLQNAVGDGSEFQKRIHREARPLQPKVDKKGQSSMQGKVMKVFKDVMDNYNRTTPLNQPFYDKHYHSHQLSNTSSGPSKDGRQVRDDYSRLVRINKKEHEDYLTDAHKKNVSSQTPSKYDVTNKQVSASSSHKIYKKKVRAVQNVAASSSVDDFSSDVPSPIHQHSVDESIKSSTRKSLSESVSASGSAGDISSNVASAVDDQSRHESLKSSEYMSLPKANLVGISLPEKESTSEKSKFRRRRQVYSDHISDPSMKSEPAFPIDSELALKSSNVSSKMSTSVKDNPYAEPHSNRNLESKNRRPTAIQKTSTKSSEHKSSSSASSGNSHNTLKEIKSDSSVGKGDTSRSYLESVSDASTDKDVKSLTLSEVYSSAKDKNLEISSEKEKEVAVENLISLEEKLSKGPKSSAHSPPNSNHTLKKSQTSHVEKLHLKDNESDASIPSLSDITTVSSRSLNTDSVMDQLSEN